MSAALSPIVLPNRRPGFVRAFDHDGFKYDLCIGIDPASGRPGEVFLSLAEKSQVRPGSQLAERNENDMIALSKLLQAGEDPAELAATFGPASLLGAVAARVAAFRDGLLAEVIAETEDRT